MDSIHLPNAITLPTAFGAPGTPLQVGQVVQALVLDLIESNVFRLQLPQATVDVRSDVPLAVGSTVTLAVKGGGANARLVIYADDARPVAPARQAPLPQAAVAAPTLSGKHPVGEAVIIARAPVQPGRAPVDARVLRNAPPIAPTRLPQPQQQPPQPPQIVTPERALDEAVRAAATKQSGLAPLFADVEVIARAAPGTLPVPPAIRAAATQLAALRVPLDENLTASDVKQAFVRSGVLFEPRVAAGIAVDIARPSSTPNAPASPDIKAALLILRQVLKTWSDDTAPIRASAPPIVPGAPDHADAPRAALPLDASIKHLANALAGAADELLPVAPPLSPEQATTLAKSVATQLVARDAPDHPAVPAAPNGPPPPYRGAPLSAQQPAAPTIAPDTPPHESAERLLAATDGALARTTLLQAASLPDQQTQRIDPAAQRWTFEVPFASPQGTAIAQFEVSRDGQAAKSDRPLATWRARFSLDVEPMGPVHALVALAGPRASVTLWAERHATAAKLNDSAAMLGDALRAAALEPADMLFRVGAPPNAAKQAALGRFMDRAT